MLTNAHEAAPSNGGHEDTSDNVYSMLTSTHEATPLNGGHDDTSDNVYSMLTNAQEDTPSNGSHEYAILDEKMRQVSMSHSSE